MSERRGTKALELWCRRMTEGYPGVKIDNMTTAWRDGLAFCAMIHHFRPDLIDFDKLNKSDVHYNNTLAFTTAEKFLGIPALLDADDMAAYEVPDRLSILTYLSQFYQVFAAQEAHSRLKRSSSSATDKAQISKSSGPPSKMAHVVGVPKRDPCRKCQLPVFLAERLMVGKNVYHRTCLKCARCGYQLTPGSFYETEIDEQYCCETCPDEELTEESKKQLSLDSGDNALDIELRKTIKSEANVLKSTVNSVRNSIQERLAFFESHRNDDESDAKVMHKSLSDEEKSKSLQRIERSPGIVEASYKSNVSLSNFLDNIVDKKKSLNEALHSKSSKMQTSEYDSGDITNVSLPPKLPTSLPPPLGQCVLKEKIEEKQQFSVSAPLLWSGPLLKTDELKNIQSMPVKENKTVELQIHLSSSTIDNIRNNNINYEDHIFSPALKVKCNTQDQSEEETVKLYTKKVEQSLEFNETNDNDCVTKDKSADGLITMTTDEDMQQVMDKRDTGQTNIELVEQYDEFQKFENMTSVREDIDELSTKTSEQIDGDKEIEQPNLVLARLQHIKNIPTNELGQAIPRTLKQPQDSVVESEILSNEEENKSKLIRNGSYDTGLMVTEKKKIFVNSTEIETGTKTILNVINKVPLIIQTEDNETLENKCSEKRGDLDNTFEENINVIQTPPKNNIKIAINKYPEDLNPFKSDEDEKLVENNKENVKKRISYTKSAEKNNLNPFDSSDDEVELEKAQKSTSSNNAKPKVPPPRPPPPRISKNPFGSEDEDENLMQNFNRRSSLIGSQNKKTPIPTPRSNILQSQNLTPEPKPRFSTSTKGTVVSCSSQTTPNNSSLSILQNSGEFYGSANSLYSNNTSHNNILRNSEVRSSNNSLNLSGGGTIRSRKSRRAPLPPAPVKELFPSNETISSNSKASTPSSSTVGTPKSVRKKRPAPAPPKPARLEPSKVPEIHVCMSESTQPKNLNNYPLQRESDSKLSDEEKVLLEGKTLQSSLSIEADLILSPSSRRSSKRLIPLDQELLEEHGSLQYGEESNSQCDDFKQKNQQKSPAVYEEEPTVVYRRVLIPQNLETPTHEHNPLIEDVIKSPLGERQLEKLKDNKEANNRNRQSQISVISLGADDSDTLCNKSACGKWKRRKGPAPALPMPPRKVFQMLPLQEIKHELEIIEVQQQGLEKQGVVLEKMIRDRCEGENGEPLNAGGLPGEGVDPTFCSSTAENSKEVENLILQLFELVNEKNELFRRQAELMYLRRQHRLEQEQADLEYEIRILMAQPERNKTDSDKAREEALIERLIAVVKLRNEVVECLEMDRLREAEEDQSIKQRLESHIAKREDSPNMSKTPTKLSKKEKKKQKEAKKLFKSKKLDADKDADESELNADKQKSKKKKKLLIF